MTNRPPGQEISVNSNCLFAKKNLPAIVILLHVSDRQCLYTFQRENAEVSDKCKYAYTQMAPPGDPNLRAAVSEILHNYIDDDKKRSQLYDEHCGLQPVFDFFGTRLADDYRLLLEGVQDLGINSELVVFTLHRTNDGTIVAGCPHHRLLFKRIRDDVMICEESHGKAVQVKSDNVIVLVRPGGHLTRDVMEYILAME